MRARNDVVRFLFLFLALNLISCTGESKSRVVTRWDAEQSKMNLAVLFSEGVVVFRETATKGALEVYGANGNLLASTLRDHLVRKIEVRGRTVYFLEESEPEKTAIWRWNWPQPPARLSEETRWVDFLIEEEGRILGFESIYATRDHPPSAVRVVDLTTGETVFMDMNSFHYPVPLRRPLLLSAIDRGLRRTWEEGLGVVGALNEIRNPPILNQSGTYCAWFGPHRSGTALYTGDAAGGGRAILAPYPDHPLAWAGETLLVAEAAALTGKWSLRRFTPDGTELPGFPIPAGIRPDRFLASEDGRFVGFPKENGSALLFLESGFLEEFPGVPLASWRFSPDGRRLFFIDQHRIEARDLAL